MAIMNLDRPPRYYFEICRQIEWYRLTYDKLYVLQSMEAKGEVIRIWHTALYLALADLDKQYRVGYYSVSEMLTRAVSGDDGDWAQVVLLVENKFDMKAAIDDYFLGVKASIISAMLKDGEYDK